MTTITHILGGYAVVSATQTLWSNGLPEEYKLPILIYGVVLSIAIDFDTYFTKGIKDHHKQLTHYPAFWFLICVAIFMLGLFTNNPLIKSISIITLISSFTHLAMDLVGITMGVHLFWPFSKKEFSITPLKTNFYNEKERMKYILRSRVMWVGDSIVIIMGLIKLWFDLVKI